MQHIEKIQQEPRGGQGEAQSQSQTRALLLYFLDLKEILVKSMKLFYPQMDIDIASDKEYIRQVKEGSLEQEKKELMTQLRELGSDLNILCEKSFGVSQGEKTKGK